MEGNATQERIIATAKQLFREKGYHAMRVSDISRILGISKGNLTYYYPTKNSLISSLFDRYFDAIDRYIDNARLPVEHFYSRELYTSLIGDINILSDPQIRHFYGELINEPVQWEIIRKTSLRQIRTLHAHDCVVATAQELDYFAEGMAGAYNAIDKMFIARGEPDNMEAIYTHVTLKQIARAQFWTVHRVDTNVQDTRDSIVRHVKTLRNRDFSRILLL